MSVEFEGDTKELAEKTLVLTEENNRILKSMRRSARVGLVFRVFYWIVISLIAIGGFYYVQPYMDQIMKSYSNIKATETKLSNFPPSWTDVKNYFVGGTSTKEVK